MNTKSGCIYDRWPLHFREWDNAEGVVQLRAIQARENGVNHRNFKVGAAALIYNPRKNIYDILGAANFKPEPGSQGARVCAEEEIIVIARLRGYRIIGIQIAGDYQPDEDSEIPFKALVPCGRCRQKLLDLRNETNGLITRRTRIISFRLNGQGGVDRDHLLELDYGKLMRVAPPQTEGEDLISLSDFDRVIAEER